MPDERPLPDLLRDRGVPRRRLRELRRIGGGVMLPGELRFLESVVVLVLAAGMLLALGWGLFSPVGPYVLVVATAAFGAVPLWLARRHARPSSRTRRASADAARIRHEDEAMAVANGGPR